MTEGPPYINQSILDDLKLQFPEAANLERHPLTQKGAPTLLDFMGNFITHYQQQVYRFRTGQLSPEDFQKPVLLVIGPPNSGKTRNMGVVKRILNAWPNLDLNMNLPIPAKDHPLKVLDWEMNAEKRARDAGEITSRIDETYNPQEMAACHRHLKQSIFDAIKDRSTQAVLAEIPAGTALQINDQWVGRDSGSSTVKELVQGEDIFSGLNQPLSEKYDPWIAGFRAGPVVRFLLLQAREKYRKYAEQRDLIGGIKTAVNFGVESPPSTLEELAFLGRGASLKQMEYYDQQAEVMLEAIRRSGVNIRIPSVEDYAKSIDQRVYHFVPSSVVNSAGQRALPLLLEHYMAGKGQVEIPSWKMFLGNNDPTFEEANLDINRLLIELPLVA